MENKVIQLYLENDIEIIIEQHQNDLYQFCWSLTRNKTNADDLFQDTWLKVVEKLDKYQRNYDFKNWLFKIALNIYRDKYRRSQRSMKIFQSFFNNESLDTAMENVSSNESLPEDTLINKEDKQVLHHCIDKLNDKYRLPIILYYFNELPQKTIAEIMKLPVGTVKSRMNKGKKLLSKMMEGEENGQIRINAT